MRQIHEEDFRHDKLKNYKTESCVHKSPFLDSCHVWFFYFAPLIHYKGESGATVNEELGGRGDLIKARRLTNDSKNDINLGFFRVESNKSVKQAAMEKNQTYGRITVNLDVKRTK